MARRARTWVSNLLSVSPLVVRATFNAQAIRRALSRARITGPPDAPALLFFDHFFGQDVRALERAATSIRLVVVDAPSAFRFTRKLFPQGVVDLVEAYSSAPERARLAHRAACEEMLRTAVETMGVHAVGATNDAFYWYREFLSVAAELGVKRVVIDKEGTISPHDWVHEAERLRDNAPFGSDRIYVWSERQRRFWSSVGARPDSIVVTGQPRSDLLFDAVATRLPDDVPTNRPLATFFAFAPDAYVPQGVPGRESAWCHLRNECVDAIAEASKADVDAYFVVKLHPQDASEAFYRDRLAGLANVQVRRDSASAYALLTHSRVIVAFQTTAAIEAGPMGKMVVYPGWDPLEQQLRDSLLPLSEMAHVVSVGSKEELVRTLVEALKQEPGDGAVSPRSNEYLDRCDGHVSARILQDVVSLIR